MRLFDSHAHLNIGHYSNKTRHRVIREIEASDVAWVVDIGYDLSSSAMAAKHAAEYPWCYATVGVHPHDVAKMDDGMLEQIRALSAQPKVKAIGEIGLDYYRNLSPADSQRNWFRKQIKLALDLGMPITIHDRDSGGETIDILKEEGAFDDARKRGFQPNPLTGGADARVLLHCFSGTAADAMDAIKLGATISIAGTVTFKNNVRTAEVARTVPLAHLLIETDAPYLAPAPFRGKPNSSPLIAYTAQKIADLKNIPVDEIAEATAENAKRFYDID